MIIQRKNCVSTLYFYQAKWSPASRAACSGYFKKKKKIQENVKEGRGDQFQTKQNKQ